jgi:hypothetical protein
MVKATKTKTKKKTKKKTKTKRGTYTKARAWTDAEDDLLLNLNSDGNNAWSIFVPSFSNRSRDDIRNRWRSANFKHKDAAQALLEAQTQAKLIRQVASPGSRFKSTARVCRMQYQKLHRQPAALTGPQSLEVGEKIGGILTGLHESLLSQKHINLLMAEFNKKKGFASHPAGTGRTSGVLHVPKTGYTRIYNPFEMDNSDLVKIRVWEAARGIVKCIRDTLHAKMENFASEINPGLLDDTYSPDAANGRSFAQNRVKCIMAKNSATTGYTTYSKLTDTYLNGATNVSTREAKTESNRLDGVRNRSVAKVHRYQSGHKNGTVSTLTAAENAGFLHGMEFDVDQAAGRCTPHQDWMTEETLVFAFAIFRNGLRVMLQLTMRIKGGIAKAQAAMSILRKHLFGELVQETETSLE